MTKFVLIVVLVAGAVVAVGARRDLVSPAALPDGTPLPDAFTAAFAEPESSIRKAAPQAVTARRAPSKTTEGKGTETEGNGAEVVPWLNPLPPLLTLMLSAESPDVRAHAEKLNRWLKLTAEVGVKPCWARRPPKQVWAEFSAELQSGDGPNSVGVSQLKLVKIHGDYLLRTYFSRPAARHAIMPHVRWIIAKYVSSRISQRTRIRLKRFIQPWVLSTTHRLALVPRLRFEFASSPRVRTCSVKPNATPFARDSLLS